MVRLLSGVTMALTAFSLLGSTFATRLAHKLRRLTPGARDVLKMMTPAAPRFVIYSDIYVDPLPTPAELKGYNVFALSFWMTYGASDMAETWQQFSASKRANYLNEYNAAGITMIVSAFGADESPTSSRHNSITVANDLAAWVLKFGLQGVDVDYEDFNAFDGSSGAAEPWVISLTRQLRTHLPVGQYILTHAPIAPWFSPNTWTGGGYLKIDQEVGDLIDWYNIQFYNQGSKEYTNCTGLLTQSSRENPESSVFQLAANGVNLNKLVIGKPAFKSDVNNGYMKPADLAVCVKEAVAHGWHAGVMVWEYPHAAAAWMATARGTTF